MNLPIEIKNQVASRIALITELMADGELNTPIECLETPMLLVMNMPDDSLMLLVMNMPDDSLDRLLKKTRKRQYKFGLNGRIYIFQRCDAIALVVAEINARSDIEC